MNLIDFLIFIEQLFPAINQAALHGIIYLTWLMIRTISHLLDCPSDISIFTSMHKGIELTGDEQQAVELAFQLIKEHVPKDLYQQFMKLESLLGPKLCQIKRIVRASWCG